MHTSIKLGLLFVSIFAACGPNDEASISQGASLSTQSQAISAGCPTDWTDAPVSCVGQFYLIDANGRCMRRKTSPPYTTLRHDVCKPSNEDRTHLIFKTQNNTYAICKPNDFAKIEARETRHGLAGTLTAYQARCAVYFVDAREFHFMSRISIATKWIDDGRVLPPEETWFAQGAIVEDEKPNGFLIKWNGDGRYLTSKDSNSYIGLYGNTGANNQRWHAENPWP